MSSRLTAEEQNTLQHLRQQFSAIKFSPNVEGFVAWEDQVRRLVMLNSLPDIALTLAARDSLTPDTHHPDLEACATIDALVNVVRELSLGLLSQRELRRMWLRMRLPGQHLPAPDDLQRFFARFDAHRRLLSMPPSHDQLTDTLVSALPDCLALPVMAKLEDVNVNDNKAFPSVPHLWSRLVCTTLKELKRLSMTSPAPRATAASTVAAGLFETDTALVAATAGTTDSRYTCKRCNQPGHKSPTCPAPAPVFGPHNEAFRHPPPAHYKPKRAAPRK